MVLLIITILAEKGTHIFLILLQVSGSVALLSMPVYFGTVCPAVLNNILLYLCFENAKTINDC